MSEYTVTIVADYEPPAGPMTKEQYLNFVMNRAAESYMRQYGTPDPDSGIQAAADVYNAGLADAQTETAPE
jgi:hypothetical protein